MTTQPDVYSTIGPECGCCGHRHATVQEAGGASTTTGGVSSPTAAWSPSRPTPRGPRPQVGNLNDAELNALYRVHVARRL